MKRVITLSLFFFSQFCTAQNLVPNGSFEDTLSCPDGPTQINRASGWSSYRRTPDYYNSCSSSFAGVPFNYDFQYAEDGNAYAGIVVTSDLDKECIGIQLIQPLLIGAKYFVSFYVNRMVNTILGVNGAANKIGVKFSTVSYSASLSPIPLDSHAQIFTDSIITDSMNWVRISGSFISDSAYQFVSIGNFFNDSLISKIFFDSTSSIAYYFIDDIKVSSDSFYVNNTVELSLKTDDRISIFPNPTNSWLNITGNNVKEFWIYNALGRRCSNGNLHASSTNMIDVRDFAPGIYLIQIASSKSIFSKIFILTN